MAHQITIPIKNVVSLLWRGDELVDWLGNSIYSLDGTSRRHGYAWQYKFDQASVSPSGEYVLLVARTGTKALVLRNGELLREINRSFYHAHAYEYPATIFRLPDGREVLAHCPDRYCQIELDELPSFQRLTARQSVKPQDFFHSRLAANSQGTWLLDVGWVWHPFQTIQFYNIRSALTDPLTLDRGRMTPAANEITSAAFRSENEAVLVSEPGAEDLDDEEPDPFGPGAISVFDVAANRLLSSAPIGECLGTIHSIGPNHVLSLYDHPKLVEVATGKIVQRWENLKTNKESGPIIWSQPPAVVAVDAKNRRFAVADASAINVVNIDGF